MTLSKADIVKNILPGKTFEAAKNSARCFAPSNIALIKYWGKRNQVLNLPLNSSLSVSLGNKGTETRISLSDRDEFILNGAIVPADTEFSQRLKKFLDLFRPHHTFYQVDSASNIPIAAGLASSASGFAAVVKALDELYGWGLNKTELSILSRLGSGSACRSLWEGFVQWQAGVREDGMDSCGIPLEQKFPGLCIGLLIFSEDKKAIGSREAMQRTVETSKLYQSWPSQVESDWAQIKAAISNQDFEQLGITAERNALAMHATMLSSWPPILYSSQATLAAMQKVWQLRSEGIPVYFTQDAGPNLKLLFLSSEIENIKAIFPQIQVIQLFNN